MAKVSGGRPGGKPLVPNGGAGPAIRAVLKEMQRTRANFDHIITDGRPLPADIVTEVARFAYSRGMRMLMDGEDDEKVWEWLERSAKISKELLPFLYPKLSSIDHLNTPPPAAPQAPGMVIEQLNVALVSAIDRLAAGGGAEGHTIDADGRPAGGSNLRLELLGKIRTIAAGAQPADT